MNEQLQVASRPDELSVAELVARKHKIREVMDAVMIEGVHYGQIPGTQKPSLWQPGAETLFNTFGLAPDLDIEDLSKPDEIRYRVTCHVRHVASGEIVGTGIGEASSNEEKYRWRAAVCDEEWAETLEDRRRKKWKKGYSGKPAAAVDQVRAEPADIANTILKMAAKRARVDGAKSTCGASDVFDQDTEDLARLGVELEGGSEKPTVQEPQAKPAPARSNGGGGDVGFVEAEWDAARKAMHERGTITDKQLKRLFAIATGNGWTSDQVKSVVLAALGVDPSDLPWGDPYNTVVGIFEAHTPDAAEATARQDPDASSPADELPPVTDDEIPF